MQEIVINDDYGGFGLSAKARSEYKKQTGRDPDDEEIRRNDPILVSIVKKLGHKANCNFASLKIVEIPDNIEWQIEEYDGKEWVAEKHRTWR